MDKLAPQASMKQLSKVEQSITSEVARNKSCIEIARELGIHSREVNEHLASIYKKLGIASMTQLASYAKTAASDPNEAAQILWQIHGREWCTDLVVELSELFDKEPLIFMDEPIRN